MWWSESLLGVTHSLWYVFNKDTAPTLDPLSFQPSFLLCLLCLCLHACKHTCAHTHKPQTCGRVTHWTKSVWKRLSKRMSPSPLVEIRKKMGVWNTAADALVEDQEYVNLTEMLLYQISVCLCCSVTEDWIPGVGTQLSLYEHCFYLLNSWFLFSHFHQSGKLYLSTPWSPHPELPFVICGPALTGRAGQEGDRQNPPVSMCPHCFWACPHALRELSHSDV